MEISTLATYHCLAFVWYFFIAYSTTQVKAEEPPSEVFLYGGQWKYLTVLNLFVSISFWTLYTYNRELVYPKSLDGVIPLWLNHAMHTAVFPFALLEILALPHRYPAKKKGLILLGFVAFLYISWVLWIYSVTGEWVYPLFALFSPSGLAAFFAGSLAIIISCYNFGEFLNRMIWGDSIVIMDHKWKGK
ncbi:androgen-dependent TFPI-regulating protein isoform X3 [Corvus cornix cornix]|uniref:androgen-dependent TFPI-regulating protein isoform X3 n=1 Tax=Corvus cornix cornix TaxID=932674 RepID=UPI0005355CDE|nr:androgen-dependent TFPI-regulating protein isoform X3 [Corvus cornix cornix]XP_017586137.1 PREDICTED: androgen-dependent TFPI-regulating protein isoform X3 [Corvus brachyrhynchos]